MMNDEMLRNIEYLREKADVSYEEAATLLERYDGNVMRVLVELERQGRIFPQGNADYNRQYTSPPRPEKNSGSNTKEKASGFITKAFQHRLVVEKNNNGEKETVANLSAPYCAGAAIVAPHLAVASVALMFVCGYRVRLKKEKPGQMPEDVETFVDKAVSNIKKTASSLSETVHTEVNKYKQGTAPEDPEKHNDHQNDDDNDEGGEITIE